MKKVSIDISGVNKVAYYQTVQDTLWLHVDGETYSFKESGRKGRKKSASKQGATGETVAPMPGKIIKVMVEPGQTTNEGDVLVVLEAMKMEYTLKSEIAGRVDAVGARVGDQVKVGALLVKVTPEEKL